jgi:hypothetical protein
MTFWGGKVDTVLCRHNYQDLVLKDTFLTTHLTIQSWLGLKISAQNQKNVTRGGGVEKEPKVSRIIWMTLKGLRPKSYNWPYSNSNDKKVDPEVLQQLSILIWLWNCVGENYIRKKTCQKQKFSRLIWDRVHIFGRNIFE